jgi:hypothetical protein
VLATALVATLAASANIAAPVPAGPAASSSAVAHVLSMQPDPREGAWLTVASPEGERLVRIDEDGQLESFELPAQLRGEGVQITPLRDGWTVAVDRYWPGGAPEEASCQPIGSDSGDELGAPAAIAGAKRCGELVVGQLSPGGRWSEVQPLAHSYGREAEASEAVETARGIELAWSEAEQFAPTWVALARSGHPFGPARAARPVLHREANRIVTLPLHGALYQRGEYSPDPPSGPVTFFVDRRLYGNGSLGPPHVVRSRLIGEQGGSFEGVDGSELWVYGGVYSQLAFARRRLWAPAFQAPRVIVKRSDGGEQITQSQNHRTLISLETPLPGGRTRIGAVEISPSGRLGALRGVEAQPPRSEQAFSWDAAIDDAGSVLIALSGGPSAGQIWLRADNPRCAGFRSRSPLATASKGTPVLSAGRDGLFHVAWVDSQNEVQTSTVPVSCELP